MFWNKQSLKKISLVCDIGSASVGMALVDFGSSKPTVLSVSRIPISIQEEFKPETLEKQLVIFFDEALRIMSESLKEVSLKNKVNNHVDIAHFFFSAPWYISKSTSLQIEKDKAFVLDQHSLETLIEGEEKNFRQELSSKNENSFIGDMAVIERELLSIELNGYETDKPFLKKINNASLSLFISVISHRLLKIFEEKVKTAFHIEHIFAHAFPLAVFRALKLSLPEENKFVFFDITGEATDIILVENSSIIHSASFSLGRNAFLRSIAKAFDVPYEVALSFVSLFASGQLDESTRAKFEIAQKSFSSLWKEEVLKALSVNKQDSVLSQRFFVTIDDDVAPIFMHILKNITADERNVFRITQNAVKEKLSYAKYVREDPFLALGILSVMYFSETHHLQ